MNLFKGAWAVVATSATLLTACNLSINTDEVLCNELGDEQTLYRVEQAFSDPEAFEATLTSCAENPEVLVADIYAKEYKKVHSLFYVDEVFSLSDRDGYTFDLGITVEIIDVRFERAYDKPGYMSVTVQRQDSLEIINTTHERHLGFGNVHYVISDDPARISSYIHFDSGHRICGYLETQGDTCRYLVNTKVVTGPTGPEPQREPYFRDHRNPLQGIPESLEETVEHAFANPVGFSVEYFGDDSHRFSQTCAGPGNFPALAQSGGCTR